MAIYSGESGISKMSRTPEQTSNLREWAVKLGSDASLIQAHRRLAVPTDGKLAYCCLGVACEMSGLGRWKDNPLKEGEKVWESVYGGVTVHDGLIPGHNVLDYFGITKQDADVLATLNDTLKFSFRQIAAVIFVALTYHLHVSSVLINQLADGERMLNMEIRDRDGL